MSIIFANDKTKKTLEKNNKSVTETSVGNCRRLEKEERNCMNQPVLLKGNSLGLTMVLDPGMKFDQLIKAIEDKFVQAKDFFNGQTQIATKDRRQKTRCQRTSECTADHCRKNNFDDRICDRR